MAKRKRKTKAKKSKAAKPKTRTAKPRKKTAKRRPARRPRRRLLLFSAGLALGLAISLLYLDWHVTRKFEGRRWNIPAHVYAQPLELYTGLKLTAEELELELRRLGYRAASSASQPGTYRRAAGRIDLTTRHFQFWDGDQQPVSLSVGFAGRRVESLNALSGKGIPLARLDPLLIGSIFAEHGEDRIVVAPEDVPPLLPAALKVVEDRKFDRHHGIDFMAIARALLVNLKAGEIRQGGSTLTQQLVKSYFLDNRRTLWRKMRESVMALILEFRFEKEEILTAYINEVYLGQDGRRAIHGFGLASQFYFAKPLAELDLHEIALLVAIARGPSYYDPRSHPARARERRDLVLRLMAEFSVIDEQALTHSSAQELGVFDGLRKGASYYPAFMKLVRQQLSKEYKERDLTDEGLKIFTTLNAVVQSAAEEHLSQGLGALNPGQGGDLEGAIVITSTQNAEILAVVGGRRANYDGFNRALDARRQIGSLIKPVVYLAALEDDRYHLASPIDDSELVVELDNGQVWAPENFDKQSHGVVPLIRALAESMNLATVRIGTDIGVGRVVKLLEKLAGVEAPAYPSLLLGSVDLSPIEVAQLYNTLAGEGFFTPLRSVRSVLDGSGRALRRYPLEVTRASDPAAVYQLNLALVEVMERGTARSSKAQLAGRRLAGKTGTSDGLRDSWFAGFNNDYLAVVWVGYDDNRPTGLTGASGALGVWTRLMRDIEGSSFAAVKPEELENVTIEYETGLAAEPRCADVVEIAVPPDAPLQLKEDCDWKLRRLPKWLKRLID